MDKKNGTLTRLTVRLHNLHLLYTSELQQGLQAIIDDIRTGNRRAVLDLLRDEFANPNPYGNIKKDISLTNKQARAVDVLSRWAMVPKANVIRLALTIQVNAD